MPILLLLLGLSVFLYLWLTRRNSTLTRDCRWREERGQAGEGARHWRCAFCGATAKTAPNREPRDCLNPVTGAR